TASWYTATLLIAARCHMPATAEHIRTSVLALAIETPAMSSQFLNYTLDFSPRCHGRDGQGWCAHASRCGTWHERPTAGLVNWLNQPKPG
ncbi:hypothetical protein V8C86DRAFT_2450077, partial [Haematococcus lacustris]